MSALVACAACSRHVKRSDAACPHCGAVMPREGSLLKTATAMLMGLGLTSCVEALYGVPTTSDSGTDTDGTTTAGTTEGTTEATTDATTGTATDTATSTTSTTSTTTTTTDTTAGTTAESTSTTDMTTAEPDYGVPDTGGLR